MAEPIFITISKDILITELYRLRSVIEPDNDDAKKIILDLIELVSYAPVDLKKAMYPRTRGQRL